MQEPKASCSSSILQETRYQATEEKKSSRKKQKASENDNRQEVLKSLGVNPKDINLSRGAKSRSSIMKTAKTTGCRYHGTFTTDISKRTNYSSKAWSCTIIEEGLNHSFYHQGTSGQPAQVPAQTPLATSSHRESTTSAEAPIGGMIVRNASVLMKQICVRVQPCSLSPTKQ
jgi:hypothetical protein